MHVSRFVSLVAKPLLSSFSPRVAPVVWAPCRVITTDQAHVRFRKGSGKKPQHKDMDVLLGRWLYDPDDSDGDKIAPEDRARVPKGQYVIIGRDNKTWNFELGSKDYGCLLTYRFRLNEYFPNVYSGVYCRGMAQKFGDNGLEITSSVRSEDVVLLRITAEAVKDKLFVTMEPVVGPTTLKAYIRE